MTAGNPVSETVPAPPAVATTTLSAAAADAALRKANLQGIVFMLIAMACFALGDALMKLIAERVPLYQAITLRSLVTLPLLLLMARGSGGLQLGRLAGAWQPAAWRTFGEVGATLCFFVALMNLPLATVSAINQVVPLAVTAGAALIFGETIGWRRILAILAGFCGVLLIVRPGAEGMNGYAVFALASVCFVVLRDLATRRLDPGVSSTSVALMAAVAVAAVAVVLSLREPWQAVPLAVLPLLGIAGLLVPVGYIFVIRTMRVGQVAVVTPFRYTALIWALGLSWLFWDHVPDGLSLVGAAIVVGSGMFTLIRTAQVAPKPQQSH